MTDRPIPIAEVFGPTIQGEGPDAGRPCYFVRTGGCDYACSWCDSLHAVLPESVRTLERLASNDIVDRLVALGADVGSTVVLSGGNPVLHDLGPLTCQLNARGMRCVVETQGSRWRDWLWTTSLVVCSPKPPSSRMVPNMTALDGFVDRLWNHTRGCPSSMTRLALKVVVGTDEDYDFAKVIHQAYPTVPFFMSVLNPAGSDADEFDIETILRGYRNLCERTATDPDMRSARVMPQLHTLAWGAAMGV